MLTKAIATLNHLVWISIQSKKHFDKPEELCTWTRMQPSHEEAGYQVEHVYGRHTASTACLQMTLAILYVYTNTFYRSFLKPLASRAPG